MKNEEKGWIRNSKTITQNSHRSQNEEKGVRATYRIYLFRIGGKASGSDPTTSPTTDDLRPDRVAHGAADADGRGAALQLLGPVPGQQVRSMLCLCLCLCCICAVSVLCLRCVIHWWVQFLDNRYGGRRGSGLSSSGPGAPWRRSVPLWPGGAVAVVCGGPMVGPALKTKGGGHECRDKRPVHWSV